MKMLERVSAIAGGIVPSGQSSLLTLSIEGATLNLLLVKKGRIVSWLTVPFNPRMVNRGFIQDPPALSGVLKTAVARLGGRGAGVIAAYSGASIVTRVLTVSGVQGSNLEGFINRESRRFLGTATDSHHLFWAPLDEELKGRYYVVAVPRREMDNFMQTMTLGGLRPKTVEPPSIALARGVGMSDATILNVGPDRLEVMRVNGFLPEITTQRDLDLGMSAQELVAAVSDEVERATSYYAEGNPSESPPTETPTYLVGRHPQVDESLAGALQASLRRPVLLPTTSLPSPPDFPVAQYVVNVGLALTG